jgi:hypothetical protein
MFYYTWGKLSDKALQNSERLTPESIRRPRMSFEVIAVKEYERNAVDALG